MSKAVLISIRPEWCEKIARGEKTVEVRKTRPKLETPFKCYVYRTKGTVPHIINGKWVQMEVGGTIIAEFTCDRVKCIMEEQFVVKEDAEKALEGSLMTISQAKNYAKWKKGTPHYECKDLYGWYISNLKIYDTPKELTEFHTWKKCKSCSKSGYESTACIYDENCMVPVAITKAPQSWCYVEEQ